MIADLPSAGRIEQHPQGGWQVVIRNAGEDLQLVGHDGRGLSREEAEVLLRKLNHFIASRN
jgi:hypothetical protein